MTVCDEGGLLRLSVKPMDTFFGRLKGLMFQAELPAHHGLLLKPCSSIHTCFMRFPIDVVYIDDSQTVLEVETILPWRLGRLVSGTRMIIETTAGSCQQLRIGSHLIFSNTM